MPKEIVISPHENVKITVTVTEQMEKDFLECSRIDGKDCDTCSWCGVEFSNVVLCELEVMLERVKEE